MLGLLVVFLLSWLLLRVVARQPIGVLGITPNKRRLKELLIGGLFMAGVGVINFLWQAHFKERVARGAGAQGQHLGLPTAAPFLAPARSPPELEFA